MQTITLSAHFDGQNIQLDEPFELVPGSQLMVTVLPPNLLAEGKAWHQLASRNLARAYGDDEPDYSLADVKQINPDYAGS